MKRISLIVFLAMASLVSVFAQSYTGDQAKRGYAIFSDKVTFIFDENIYGVRPERVFVTGDFRGWDASTEVGEWELKKVGEYCISSNREFKTRMRSNILSFCIIR